MSGARSKQLGVALLFCLGLHAEAAGEWRFANGDPGGARYSPLTQINRSNVHNLRQAWTYHTGDKSVEPKTTIECTPIVVDGVMYVTSPRLKAIALDAATGKIIWTYDPFSARRNRTIFAYIVLPLCLAGALGLVWIIVKRSRRSSRRLVNVRYHAGLLLLLTGTGVFRQAASNVLSILDDEAQLDPWRVNRGLTYWQDGPDKRILFTAGYRLIALRSDTGKPIPEFGQNGSVDLRKALDRDIGRSNYMVTSPGVIYRDLIILGAKTGEGPRPEAPGHVRAFDVRTGERKWIFHTIPQPGEFGYETWGPSSWENSAGANDWAGMTVDQKRGFVFLATGSPTFDFYGGDRPGMNLFGDSVIALNASTGSRVWHFQAVHHNLWDYDLPCPPVLVTTRHEGKNVDGVVQLTKMGHVFLLDRETGKPLFPVEERPVPSSNMPGESAWLTQPYPLKPPPYTRQSMTEADLTDLSPEAHEYALKQFRALQRSQMFTPPSLRGTIEFPGIHGGSTWSGGSFDPETGWLFVNSNDIPYIVKIIKAQWWANYPYDHNGYHKFEDQSGYPAIKPPWGTLNAIDLNEGRIVWTVPLGEYSELARKGIPRTGTENFGGSIVTAGGLVFIGATKDEKFHAFDKSTGKVLWETALEAGGYATPSTYAVKGRQFVVIAAGGGGQLATKSGDSYVAFSLSQ